MKKIINLIIAFGLLISLIMAASPPSPMPVKFGFTLDGQPVINYEVELKIGSETINRITNELGLVGVDVGTGSVDFPNADWRFDTLILNCGFSVCNKQYTLLTLDTPYTEIFALSERPPTTCPTSCPSCSGGGGGSCYIAPSDCEECPEPVIYPLVKCTQEECKEIISPTEPCDECPSEGCPEILVIPEGLGSGERIIWIISLVFASGLGIYFTKNKTMGLRAGLKTYKKSDGTIAVLHKHPGIRGYHNPETSHRDEHERHPKGQLFPHYEKNSEGVYIYIR